MTDNELIAEFMGLKSFEDSRYGTLWPSPLKAKTPATCFGLCYHESWDWLMPVVHKILITWIPENGQWPYEYTVLQKMLLGSGIKQVYACVVEFIKWYNENKTK